MPGAEKDMNGKFVCPLCGSGHFSAHEGPDGLVTCHGHVYHPSRGQVPCGFTGVRRDVLFRKVPPGLMRARVLMRLLDEGMKSRPLSPALLLEALERLDPEVGRDGPYR